MKLIQIFQRLRLIEIFVIVVMLSVVVSIISFLADPSKQFAERRNAQREADLYSFINALSQYKVEHAEKFPSCIGQNPTHLGKQHGFVDLNFDLVPAYLVAIPKDPKGGTDEDTKYSIFQDEHGVVTIVAVGEMRKEKNISVSR